MSWASVVAARMRGLFRRERFERELDAEVRFHLEMLVEDYLRSGMTPAEARNAALRSFGGVEPMKERYRERRTFSPVEAVAQDFRYAVRTLRKSAGFTATSVALLALAIGGNTAMFSVLNAVLLRPLPFPAPEQLAMLWTEIPTQNLREGRSAYWNIEQWRRRSGAFADMAVFDSVSATLTSAAAAERITVVRHSANLLPLLGVEPARGRLFTAEEADQRQPLALISHRFWQTRFAGSDDAIGASLEIDGARCRIIGVLPAGFQFLELAGDVWEPHTLFRDWESIRRARGSGFWSVVGRLRPAVTVEQAQAEMNAIARRLEAEAPAGQRNLGISVTPLAVQAAGASAQQTLWMLTGAVFCVLLIAATNVAGLSLARNASREREIAIRVALGASRGRIVRQLLIEGLTLTVASGLAGLLLASAGIRGILAMKPGNLSRLNDAGLDLRVLGWSLTLCLLTGLLVGLAPALTRSGQTGSRGIAGGIAARRTRRALVATEFALAMVLLVGAGLLVRSLRAAQNVELGFRPDRVLSMQLSTTSFRSPAQRAGFYSSVLEQAGRIPGVESAAIVSDFLIGGAAEQLVTTEGDDRSIGVPLRLRSDEASANVFQTVGTRLLRGRFFSASDGSDAPPAAIVNDAMARRLWPNQDPVGKRFRLGGAGACFTVVGVVADMRRQGLEREPIPQMFQPLAQNPPRLATLLARTASDDPMRLARIIQAAVRQVDKHVPLYGVTTLEERLGDFLAERRFQTSLLIGFAAVALLMAAIGIYGLVQYSIATRTHEIGIRIAVGAQSGEILRMILSEGLRLSLTGLSFGLAGALCLGRAGSSLLFGIRATDPPTFLAASLLLIVAATAACYVPARRATKVDPIVALRQD